jgi:NAD(P)H dehydrogenase (quinone)
MNTQSNVIVAYHSGYGHTEVLANAAVEGARQAGAQAEAIAVDDAESLDWAKFAAADAIIFGSPTYMGSVSAPFKAFMDASSRVWYEQGWKDKIAAGFTNSASYSGDKLNTLQQMSVFAAQHSMLWIGLGLMPGNNSTQGSPDDLNRIGSYLGAMAQSNADQGADIVPPQADRDTVRHLGKRVAEAAMRWNASASEAVAA